MKECCKKLLNKLKEEINNRFNFLEDTAEGEYVGEVLNLINKKLK